MQPPTSTLHKYHTSFSSHCSIILIAMWADASYEWQKGEKDSWGKWGWWLWKMACGCVYVGKCMYACVQSYVARTSSCEQQQSSWLHAAETFAAFRSSKAPAPAQRSRAVGKVLYATTCWWKVQRAEHALTANRPVSTNESTRLYLLVSATFFELDAFTNFCTRRNAVVRSVI